MSDVTRGGGIVEPRNYKGDVIVQVWVDSRVLATLCRWLDAEGKHPRFLSEVVNDTLKAVKEIVSDKIVPVDDTNEARSILEKRFSVNLNRGNRGLKNAFHNKILSGMRSELGRGLNQQKPDDIDLPIVTPNIDIDRIKEIMQSDEVAMRAAELAEWREEEK